MRKLVFLVPMLVAACQSESVGQLDGGLSSQVADAKVVSVADAHPQGSPDAHPQGSPDAHPQGSPDAAPQPTTVALKRCVGDDFPAHDTADFRHYSSDLISLGAPEHFAEDALTTSTGGAKLGATFEYTAFFKAIEDEDIRVYFNDCHGWQLDGTERTDGEGHISHTFPALDYGIYDVRFEVAGDVTTAAARLWILPKGTHLAVFDIDGTLTTSDLEIAKEYFYDILSGDYSPEAYEGAVDLTQAVADHNEIELFMTGRPTWLTKDTRDWLAQLGFASGAAILAPTTNDALPTQDGVGAFKLRELQALTAQGFVLDWAHGNATTDIYAYLNAGLAATNVWIVGQHAGEQGTNGVTDWIERAAEVKTLPPIAQPFH